MGNPRMTRLALLMVFSILAFSAQCSRSPFSMGAEFQKVGFESGNTEFLENQQLGIGASERNKLAIQVLNTQHTLKQLWSRVQDIGFYTVLIFHAPQLPEPYVCLSTKRNVVSGVSLLLKIEAAATEEKAEILCEVRK